MQIVVTMKEDVRYKIDSIIMPYITTDCIGNMHSNSYWYTVKTVLRLKSNSEAARNFNILSTKYIPRQVRNLRT